MASTLSSILVSLFLGMTRTDELKYEIFTDKRTDDEVSDYCKKNQLKKRSAQNNKYTPYIVFNLSAHDSMRQLSNEQALSLGNYLSQKRMYRTVLVHDPNDHRMADVKRKLLETCTCLSFPENRTATLLELAALVRDASAVVTPDTSIIHFAAAAGTPVLGFYSSTQDYQEWTPHNVKYKMVISEKGKPTSGIDVKTLQQSLDDFLNNYKI
jgi:ADP-heptose:LPS heptosyltransferase